MAKKTMDWDFTTEGILTVTHKDVDPEKKVDFKVTEFFEDFPELDSIQQNVIVYGLKQKLADACATTKDMTLTVNERITTMSNVWSRLKDGVWTQKGGERETIGKKIAANLGKLDKEQLDQIPESVKEALRAAGVKGI